MHELYDGIDILPLQWKLDNDEVDVHMIAIASNIDEMEKDLKTNIDLKPANINWNKNNLNPDIYLESDDDSQYGFGFDDDMDIIIGEPPRNRNIRQTRKLITKSTKSESLLINTQQESNDNNINNEQPRKLQITAISKTAWTVYHAPLGYCDGSSQSRCNRVVGNNCLLSNYNHYKAGLFGHGDSGPLKLLVPGVKEGIILVRFDWQVNGVKSINELPDDFQFIYIIDYQVKTLNKIEFQNFGVKIADDVIIYPLLIDKDMAKKEIDIKSINIQIEIRSQSMGSNVTILLTHLYFA